MDLTCPKCQGRMRTYERNGVHVDQCTECRGIFLDRGELEQLVDAETRWVAPAGGSPAPAPAGGRPTAPPPGRVDDSFDSPDDFRRRGTGGYGTHGGYGRPSKKKRARSFLEDLFEG